MRLKFIGQLCIIAFCLLSTAMKATHIVGGEMNYRFLGSNLYEIRLTVYRDCYLGVPPFDNPASLGIFDQNNALVMSINMAFRGLDTLPAAINDPCMIPPTDFCYEVTTYIDTVLLPPHAGGYQLAYQRCCRNANILNLVNPVNVGATYYAAIPGPEVVAVNSNPVFKHWPPPFICNQKTWTFDHSATDYDGDSLVYELFHPFDFPNPGNPQPIPPNNPPYSMVPWQAPYATNDMLGGSPPLQINPTTGVITAVPNLTGYFVIGIKVKEYRNGVQIGETLRDYQLIVKNCPSIVVASAQVPVAICGTSDVSFQNNSSGSNLQFSWYFGDPGTQADTSHLVSPSYLYPGIGQYTVTLVAYVANKPDCNDTANTTVTISAPFSASFIYSSVPCKTSAVSFTANANVPPGAVPQWQWNFGDGQSSNSANPSHAYSNAGNYNVQLIAYIPNSIGCYDTLQAQTIQVNLDQGFYIPNTFTPNGDGQNDIFRVRGPNFLNFYFAVYNRWGQLVFETNDPTVGWDGNFNGKPADPGVFAYYLKADCGEGNTSSENSTLFKKGNVTLIR